MQQTHCQRSKKSTYHVWQILRGHQNGSMTARARTHAHTLPTNFHRRIDSGFIYPFAVVSPPVPPPVPPPDTPPPPPPPTPWKTQRPIKAALGLIMNENSIPSMGEERGNNKLVFVTAACNVQLVAFSVNQSRPRCPRPASTTRSK